jgi:hypothetical protein
MPSAQEDSLPSRGECLSEESKSESLLLPSKEQSFRGHTGNHPAAVATVNAEILVGCQDKAIGERFGHAHEASIGETHGNVGVFLHKLQDWLQVLGDFEGDEQGTAAKQSAETGRTSCSEKVERLG